MNGRQPTPAAKTKWTPLQSLVIPKPFPYGPLI